MLNLFYTGVAGVTAAAQGVDVTANNIANVNTAGYKAVKANFSDLVYTNMRPGAGDIPQSGHGAKLASTDTVHVQGPARQTGRPLDFALAEPDRYFAVLTAGGVRYTRSGNFHLSAEDGTMYLTAEDGAYVLDANGNLIEAASEDGELSPGVFSFRNEGGLVREGHTRFAATDLSGGGEPAGAAVRRGWLEDSSVELTDEMASVIKLQKAFTMNAKMIQISDELMQTLNNLK